MFVKDCMKINAIKSNKIWHPFGFISDGLDDDSVTDQDGTVWRKTDLDDMNSTYGDMSYMWEYY